MKGINLETLLAALNNVGTEQQLIQLGIRTNSQRTAM
jgi:hypothetical protein